MEYVCGLSLVEDVLDLVKRIRGKDVSEPQIRRPRVCQGVEGVARYEDGRSRLEGTCFEANLDRAGPFEDEVDLGLPMTVPMQHLAGWGARLYFGARVAYVPLYAAGVPLIRSLVWNVATIGIVLLVAALFTVREHARCLLRGLR